MECSLFRIIRGVSHTPLTSHTHTFNDYIYKGFGKFQQQSL